MATVQNGLITRAAVKLALGIAAAVTANDDEIDRAIRDATQSIRDAIGGRRIIPQIATRYYSARSGGALLVDPFVSITSIKTDDDGNRVYETTWATTDYDLEPANAVSDGMPYTSFATTPDGAYSFPSYARGVQIIGQWGFPETTELSGSLLNEAVDLTETAIDVDTGTHFQAGQIIKVDSEWMHVDSISSNTLTVVRAFNGSTAATHTDDTIAYILRYPLFETAALQMTARLFAMKNAPLGIVGSGDMATQILRTAPGLRDLIDQYRFLSVA